MPSLLLVLQKLLRKSPFPERTEAVEVAYISVSHIRDRMGYRNPSSAHLAPFSPLPPFTVAGCDPVDSDGTIIYEEMAISIGGWPHRKPTRDNWIVFSVRSSWLLAGNWLERAAALKNRRIDCIFSSEPLNIPRYSPGILIEFSPCRIDYKWLDKQSVCHYKWSGSMWNLSRRLTRCKAMQTHRSNEAKPEAVSHGCQTPFDADAFRKNCGYGRTSSIRAGGMDMAGYALIEPIWCS